MTHPSFTKTYRRASYAAIDPSRPELSANDKTVIVTGAGEGNIGATVALAFARAGARRIALIGSTEKTLEATKQTIEREFPDATVEIFTADVSRAESVGVTAHNIRATLGAWDVFANCADHRPVSTTLTGADEDDWWQAFETNTRFVHLFTKHFLPKRRPNATYIGTNAGSVSLVPKSSAYLASKLAAAKLEEYLAEENPNLRVFTVHPGQGDDDEKDLPANFMVWLASPEAEFLRTRYLSANWDVEELKAREQEITADPSLFKITIGGWPFES